MGLFKKIGKFFSDITGKTAQKQANAIAQEQLKLQQQALNEAKANALRAELEADTQARRNEEERLKLRNTSRSRIGRSLGRLVR